MAIVANTELGDLLDFRFDAECYRPELQVVERRVAALKPRRMESVAHVSDGNHMSIAEDFRDSGIRYLKGAEVSQFFIDDEEPTFISQETYDNVPRAHVRTGDVLLSVIGTVGPVALVTNKYNKLSCSCKLAILRPHAINSALLAAYLLSPTGQALLLRRNRGSVQQGIVLPDVRAFPVPKFSDKLAEQVEKLIKEAAALKLQADTLYPEAETELLDRIGWDAIKKPVELSYQSEFASLIKAGRTDAEFFLPFYARVRAQLRKQSEPFGQLVVKFDKGVQPDDYDDGGEVVVVKSKQVTGRGVSLANCEHTSLVAWKEEPARVSEGDLVINSTGRGTLGRAGVIPRSGQKIVAAVDLVIARLQSDRILPEYAALFLNSPAGLTQTEQFQTGSSGQLHLYPQHFAQFFMFLPKAKDGKIDIEWQAQLARKVIASENARQTAEDRLSSATDLVEDALRA